MTMFPYHYIMVHKNALDSMFSGRCDAIALVRRMMLQIMARTDEVHWRMRDPVAREGGPLNTLPKTSSL
jgi:hypothetical protein